MRACVGNPRIAGDNLSFDVEPLWVTRPTLGIDLSFIALSRSFLPTGLGIKKYFGVSINEKTPSQREYLRWGLTLKRN